MRDYEGPGPRWARHVQAGALVATVILSVVLLGLVSSQAGRLGALERGVRDVREKIGRLEASRTASPDRKDAESDGADLERSMRRLEAATARLDRRLAALELNAPGEGLAQSIADLTKIVRELSDDLAEVRGLAEKRPAPAAARSAAAPPEVIGEDVAAIADRVARLERTAAELEKLLKRGSGASSKVRINEEALRALIKESVAEEIAKALRDMRERFRPPRVR